MNNRLAQHPKVIATPHIAASTEEAQITAAVSIAEQVVKFLEGDGSVAATLSLQMVPTEQIIPHEAVDPKRVARLASSIEKDAMLVNPPLVAERDGKFIVLDGATRTSAFIQLGIPHLVVQLADPARGDVTLHTWHHVISGPSPSEFMDELKQIPGLSLDEIPAADVHAMLREGGALATIALADGRFFHAGLSDAQHDRLDVLNAMVACYTDWGTVSRTLTSDTEQLRLAFADMVALIVFPQFQPDDALNAALQGKTLPQGITRFIIPGRVLRLNVPLEILASNEPLAAKRRWLDSFISDKLNRQRVRYYHEPVILLEE